MKINSKDFRVRPGTKVGVLREVIRKSKPYVRLTPAVADGGWTEGKYLISIEGGGLRGGGAKENDPDADHARVVESLHRNQWNVQDGTRSNVRVVVVLTRWSSHSYGELKRFCDRHGKLFVWLPGGYSPNQFASQIMAQRGDLLRQETGSRVATSQS